VINEPLILAALQARKNAYAPYSEYHVGSAVLDENGRIWSGCNVENASYPATICAERVAIGKMVSEGGTQIKGVAVSTKNGGVPCGICLQVISEFSANREELPVYCRSDNGEIKTYRFSDLLPIDFILPEQQDRTNNG